MQDCFIDWRIMRKLKDHSPQAIIRGRITINGQAFTEFETIGAANLWYYRTIAQAKMRYRLQVKLDAHYCAGKFNIPRAYRG